MMDLCPVVLVDTREQAPLPIEGFPVERATLPCGDYGILGFSGWENPAFAVERKSLPDLCASLGRERERFFREIERLRQFRFAALLIEADRERVECGDYRSMMHPAAMLASLDVIEVRAGLHIAWAGNPAGAARRLEGWVRQFARGVLKDAARLQAAMHAAQDAETTPETADAAPPESLPVGC